MPSRCPVDDRLWLAPVSALHTSSGRPVGESGSYPPRMNHPPALSASNGGSQLMERGSHHASTSGSVNPIWVHDRSSPSETASGALVGE